MTEPRYLPFPGKSEMTFLEPPSDAAMVARIRHFLDFAIPFTLTGEKTQSNRLTANVMEAYYLYFGVMPDETQVRRVCGLLPTEEETQRTILERVTYCLATYITGDGDGDSVMHLETAVKALGGYAAQDVDMRAALDDVAAYFGWDQNDRQGAWG